MLSSSFNWRFNCQREKEAVDLYNVIWNNSMNKIMNISAAVCQRKVTGMIKQKYPISLSR